MPTLLKGDMKYFAIIIDLNGKLEKLAREAWHLLKERLSINFISTNSPCPHITLESGFYGNQNSALVVIKEVASKTAPFSIKANGLGVFICESPVVHIRWINNDSLFNLRQAFMMKLSEQTSEAPHSPIAGYQSNVDWLPKTTLAYNDTSIDTLSETLRVLRPLIFNGSLEVKELTLYEYSDGNPEKQLNTVSFGKRRNMD
jgi:2'-5' RNA ligase